MNMMNRQMNADLETPRNTSEVPTQTEQEVPSVRPVYAQDEEPVAVAQGESDTFEVSMDDWFKA